jgi:hypothetical protein
MVKYSEYRGFPRPWEAAEASPLTVVSCAFDRMASQPVPADPRPVPQGAAGSWGELRKRLLAGPVLPVETVDAVWRWLIERARQRRGEQAVLACAGLAVPMLARVAGRYAAPGSADRQDVEAEIVAEFLAQLRSVSLEEPGLFSRLWSAISHAGRSWARRQWEAAPIAEFDYADAADEDALLMRTPPGHPELVLADAVTDGVITAEAAELITVTRWEPRSLTSMNGEYGAGRSYWTLRELRLHAEQTLAAWLAAPAGQPGPSSSLQAATVTALSASGPAGVRRCA